MAKKNNLASRRVLIRNIFANWSGLVAEVLVAFFLTPFIIGSLGPVVYGVWSLANGIVGYLGLIDLGVRGSLGRFINYYLARDDNEGVNQVASTAAAFLIISAAVVCVGAVIVGVTFAELFPKTPAELVQQMALVLPLLAVGVLLAFLAAVYRNILTALDRFDLLNAIGLATLVVRTALVVLVLKLGGGLLGLVAAVTGSSAIACFATVVAARYIYPTLSLRLIHAKIERLKEMWRFGVVAFLTRSASEIVYQSDQIILMVFLGPRAVAVYGIGNMLILYAQRVVEQLGAVLYPSIMKSGSVGDLASLRRAYVLYPRAAFFIGIPIYMGFIVFGGSFISLWVGSEFDQSVYVLQLLSFAELASIFAGVGGSVLFGLGHLRFNLYCSCAEAIVNLALTLVLVGWAAMGTIGAALGTLVAAIVFRGVAYPWYTTRILQMSYKEYFLANMPRAIAAATLAYALFAVSLHVFVPLSWLAFGTAVIISTLSFAVIGVFVMFGRQEIWRLLRSMPLKRRSA